MDINKYGFTMQHISDTHCKHEAIKIEDVDVILHSGDESNNRSPILNEVEFNNFVDWYGSLPIPIKIFVAGNHSTYIYSHMKDSERKLRDAGIEYLYMNSLTIYGCKFYGDPNTPRFGNWAFNKDRSKINKHWEAIPNDTNVLITHGPPKGILDTCADLEGDPAIVGDSALLKRINKLPDIVLSCFGHIHDNKIATNTGLRMLDGVIYSNASAVKDGEFSKPPHFHGNTFRM